MTEHRSSKRKLSYAQVATPAESETRPCCFLCNCYHLGMTSLSNWKSDDARKYILALDVPKGGLICQPCRKDKYSDSAFMPILLKLYDCNKKCSVQGCKSDLFTSLRQGSCEQITKAFTLLGLKTSTPTIPVPLPLCKQHYHAVYKTLKPVQIHCVTCGTSIRHSNTKLCPQPAIIELYLKKNTGFEGSICETDKVCYACYRSQLFILQKSKSIISMDSDLEQIISSPTSVKSVDELIEAATNRVVVTVGRKLLNGNVLLLSNVHDLFCFFATELLYHLNEEIVISRLVTSAYILSSLTAGLQHHIEYCCILSPIPSLYMSLPQVHKSSCIL